MVEQEDESSSWLSVTQAAVLLNRSDRTVRTWCESGVLSAVREGYMWKVSRDVLDAYIESGALRGPNRSSSTGSSGASGAPSSLDDPGLSASLELFMLRSELTETKLQLQNALARAAASERNEARLESDLRRHQLALNGLTHTLNVLTNPSADPNTPFG